MIPRMNMFLLKVNDGEWLASLAGMGKEIWRIWSNQDGYGWKDEQSSRAADFFSGWRLVKSIYLPTYLSIYLPAYFSLKSTKDKWVDVLTHPLTIVCPFLFRSGRLGDGAPLLSLHPAREDSSHAPPNRNGLQPRSNGLQSNSNALDQSGGVHLSSVVLWSWVTKNVTPTSLRASPVSSWYEISIRHEEVAHMRSARFLQQRIIRI